MIGTTPLLDVTAQISTAGESGLLGLAFDPNFSTNGFFYVNLINTAGDTEIRRYQVSANNPNVADTNFTLIISVDQPSATNHKSGWLSFGPDGYLYASLGDGGSDSTTSQNVNSLLGKMLRLDVSADAFTGDATRFYTNPADNPFVGVAGADEIWALGLRNPWRNSFDRATGDLYIADVGQSTFEEINIGGIGRNYGWPQREGAAGGAPTGPGIVTDPIHAYGRTIGQALTGGYVYRGEGDGLQGRYFFADFGSSRYFTMTDAGVVTERTAQITYDVGTGNSPASFGEDGRGNLYVVSINGSIYRLNPQFASADLEDVILGGAGDDIVYGGAANDWIYGGGDDDQGYGGAGVDVVQGEGGDDLLYGDDGADYLYGGAGSDRAIGGIGNDNLFGGDGVDFLWGREGSDILQGELGADTLDGDSGDDYIYGQEDNDTLAGGAGADRVYGGLGADTLNGGDGVDVLVGNEGADTLNGDAGADYLFGGAGIDIANGGADDDVIQGEDDGDQLNGGDGADVILGGAGADQISGGIGADYVFGGIDGDGVNGQAGADVLIGEAGNDVIDGGTENDYLYGGDDNDTLAGNDGADRLFGDDGVDSLFGEAGNDQLQGGAGVDTLNGGLGQDFLYGDDGDDMLIGGAEGDSLFGGVGADSLDGGAGGDVLRGQGGADLFVMHGGEGIDTDIVLDFEDGVDRFDLRAYSGATFANTTITNVAGGVQITFSGGDIFFVANTSAAQLSSADFLFAP